MPGTAALAETEYAKAFHPGFVRRARFGVFLHDPRFADRYDACQLQRVRCKPSEIAQLLADLEDLYDGSGLGFRKMSGHDPETWDHLSQSLPSLGWQLAPEAMMTLEAESERPVATDLDIRSVPPDSPDLEYLFSSGGALDPGFVFSRSRYSQLGGEYLVGYAGGAPVCTSGWYSVGRVARFRYVLTLEHARGRGYAGSLIRHICSLPRVSAHAAICIFVGGDGPGPLYQTLGFRTQGFFGSAFRELA